MRARMYVTGTNRQKGSLCVDINALQLSANGI